MESCNSALGALPGAAAGAPGVREGPGVRAALGVDSGVCRTYEVAAIIFRASIQYAEQLE